MSTYSGLFMSENREVRLFGSVERRLFRVTVILFFVVVFIALICAVIWALGRAVSYFFNLILALSVAGILALILYPVVNQLERRIKLSRLVSTCIVLLLFLAMIAATGLMLLPTLYAEASHFISIAPTVVERWVDYLSGRFPGMTQMLRDRMENGSLADIMPFSGDAGETFKSLVSALVILGFVPLLLFFTLLSGGRLREQEKELLSVFSASVQRRIMYFTDVFVGQVTGFFQGQLVIGLIMGAMLAAGFALVGLKGGILVGLILGLLNIVPFLGTFVGLLVVLPLAYFQSEGGLQLLGLSMLVFLLVQLVESWLLTPKIMAHRSGLHPALVVVSVIFWGIALGGIIGMILAVPLTAFIIAVWRQAKPSLSRSMETDGPSAS